MISVNLATPVIFYKQLPGIAKKLDVDADYFKWKDEQEEQEAAEEKEKSAGFQNKIKNLIGGHPHDDSGV